MLCGMAAVVPRANSTEAKVVRSMANCLKSEKVLLLNDEESDGWERYGKSYKYMWEKKESLEEEKAKRRKRVRHFPTCWTLA